MNTIRFLRAYNGVAEQILQYRNNYANMPTAQRAEGAIENLRDMNRVFADRVQDTMLGHHVNILV
jgi:hypothetical protein